MVEFIVKGKPQGKARPRVCRNGVAYTPAKTRAYEHNVLKAYAHKYGATYVPFPKGTPVSVFVEACFDIPKSWSKCKKAEMAGKPHAQKPDADNVAKIILDGVKELPFENDCQVSSILCRKRWCEPGEESHVKVKMIVESQE